MSNGTFKFTIPVNEPIKGYLPGSAEKTELKNKIKELKSNKIEIPLIINGKEVKTDESYELLCPHNHSLVLAKVYLANEEHVNEAISTSLKAHKEWSEMDWQDRAAIFMRAAEMLSGKYRSLINASTMLGQGKNAYQAEIDSACELIDFLRFNVYYMQEIYDSQPPVSPTGIWNRLEYRPLEGFVFAVTPFNFTAIGANLPASPAMMGNVVLWKPAFNAVYSNYFFMKILIEAGIPEGVINFVTGDPEKVAKVAINNKDFAGIHFTGSTTVFKQIWKDISQNIDIYKQYPKIVGETGGKDFIFAHKSADVPALATAIVRGAFEYQGQKCSAASRAYIPSSIWPSLKEILLNTMKEVTMGDVEDFTNFMGAVIHKQSFEKNKSYIEYAKSSDEAEILFGGKCDDSVGYFVEPTIILTTNPKFKTMQEEIFGPVITIYVYEDDKFVETMKICDETSTYALTGAIFANDRKAVVKAEKLLTHSAGNFYINDKPTGAVVGQQPFGGSRGSGTNDKAGSHLNLLRWVSPRAIKETFSPPTSFKYPFMEEK